MVQMEYIAQNKQALSRYDELEYQEPVDGKFEDDIFKLANVF